MGPLYIRPWCGLLVNSLLVTGIIDHLEKKHLTNPCSRIHFRTFQFRILHPISHKIFAFFNFPFYTLPNLRSPVTDTVNDIVLTVP